MKNISILIMTLSIVFVIVSASVLLAKEDYNEKYSGYEYLNIPLNLTFTPKFGLGQFLAQGRGINNYFAVNLIAGKADNLRGVETGLIYNYYYEDVYGMQLAGGLNKAHGRAAGIQIAGLTNEVRKSFGGIQLSGAANIAGRTTGIQVSGLANVSNDFTGSQVTGIANVSENTRGLTFAGLANIARSFSGIGISGIINLAENSGGFQLSGCANITEDFNGLRTGGIVNVGHDSHGIQISGCGNIGRDQYGIQLSGIVNVGERSSGISIAGIGNISEDFWGIQFSGITNVSEDNKGVNIAGLTNVARDLHGIQLGGLVNVAENLKGIQISGLVNVAGRVDQGVQIGLINIASRDSGIPIGALSIYDDSRVEYEAWFDDTGFINTGIHSGSSTYNNIIFTGIQPGDDLRWTYGLGFGRSFNLSGKTAMDIDILSQQIQEDESRGFDLNFLHRLRIVMGYQLSDYFFVYGGPAFTYFISDRTDGRDIAPWTMGEFENGGKYHRYWIGFSAGAKMDLELLNLHIYDFFISLGL